jgi:glycosyltransferase involved in cell wall biosynthesis
MRLAVIADTYPPLRISGAVQMRDLVRELADQGHEPTVIIPAPELDRPWLIERADGITVLRVRTPPTKRIGYVRRTINELRLPYVLLRAMTQSGLRATRWDGVVWYSPTIFLGPIVRALRRESGCRSYLILRDIFPEWAVDMGLMRRGLAYRFFKRVEAAQYSVADTVGVQTDANLPYMRPWARKFGFSLEVLQNWLSPAPVSHCSIDVSRTKLAGRTVFVYAGNMGVAQGMDVFLEFAARMRHRNEVGFLFVGGGSDAARFAATAEREGLDNVLFHREIEPSEIAGLLAQCHVGIVALDLRHRSHNIPGKFLTYMQAGIPVLARINPHNDLERLIESEKVGKVCTGGGPEELVRLAEELLSDRPAMDAVKERGRALWQRLFSTHAAATQVVESLRRPTSDRSRSVLILNQFFWPDVAATAQHAFDLARFLRARGDSVTAIASRSVYGQGRGALPRREQRDGIEIHRVGTTIFRSRGLASRALDFASFNIACLFKALRLPRHDVVICLTTPPFIALVGVVLRALKGTRFVFWTMDLYPDVPLAAGVIRRGSPGHRLFDLLDRFCLRRADLVVVLGRCMRNRIRSKGVSPAKIELITPWSDPQEVRVLPSRGLDPLPESLALARAQPSEPSTARTSSSNAFRAEWGIKDRFVIEYSGNCGVGHDVTSVCEAMLTLRDDDSIRWVFVGGGVTRPRIEEFIEKHRIPNVLMHPYQPRERLGELIALGDAHLVLVADGFGGLLLPSKFYGVMAAARPTVYVGPPDSEVAKVIEEVGCGYAVPNADGAALVAAIRALQADPAAALAMGLRGRRALESSYSMEIACDRWREAIHRVASAP